MNKHTPRPWEVDYTGCIVWDSEGDLVCRGVGRNDAHLIAAAPELYEALTNLVEFLQSGNPPGEGGSLLGRGFIQAKAALAKAKGDE